MTHQPSRQELLAEIDALEARLADLQDRMPAHSLPPALLAELDELDERLEELRAQLEDTALDANGDRPERSPLASRARGIVHNMRN